MYEYEKCRTYLGIHLTENLHFKIFGLTRILSNNKRLLIVIGIILHGNTGGKSLEDFELLVEILHSPLSYNTNKLKVSTEPSFPSFFIPYLNIPSRNNCMEAYIHKEVCNKWDL